MTSAGANDLRTVEVTVAAQRNTVWLTARRAWFDQNNNRHPGKTRMVRMTMDVPPTNDDLVKLVGAMSRFVEDPSRRHFKPPRAVVWREVGTSEPVPPGGGEGGENTPADMDPLPLDDGLTSGDTGSTIDTPPAPVKAVRAKRARASARDPRIRELKSGKQSTVE